MADDKTRAPDRSRIMTGQDNELRQFADTHGISVRQLMELVERVGNGRSALEAAVLMLKS